MKQLSTFVLLFCMAISFGQKKNTVSQEVVEAIKKDVWIPFMESYNELDPNKLKSIHSQEIVRITIDQNVVKSGESYLEHFAGFLKKVKQNGGKVSIAFAIESTALDESEEIAYQTGYYRFSSQGKNDEEMVVRGYGYFNVGLKLEDDGWKIWLDSDKKSDISHKDFSNHKTLYELSGPS
nr:nuclear transport factor 2 family protein [Allomuricauda sp.]